MSETVSEGIKGDNSSYNCTIGNPDIPAACTLEKVTNTLYTMLRGTDKSDSGRLRKEQGAE